MGQPMGHLNVSQASWAPRAAQKGLQKGLRIGLFGAYSEAHPGPVQAGFSLRVKGFLHIAVPREAPGEAQIGPSGGSFGTPYWDGSYGLNHIDARLGGQCNYGIWALK